MICEDVTPLIDRDFEAEMYATVDVVGVRAIYKQWGGGYSGGVEVRRDFCVEVQGEIVSLSGLRFTNDVLLQIVCLDDLGRVIGVVNDTLSEGQGGYHAFREHVEVDEMPSMIKVKALRR